MSIEFDMPVPMRDGVILYADVYRPVGDGPWPVLVLRSPYDKGALAPGVLDVFKAVRRGYIVVQQDTRGRFTSEGEWLPLAYEHEDGYDTVEWAAFVPGSNGNVGVYGASYTGNAAWAAAIASPPHLRAIAPQMTWCEPADGIFFRGGAIEHGLNVWWSLLQSIVHYPKVAADSEELFARLGTTIGDFDRMPEETYWELPSGAAPALMRTELPDIGVQRGLRDPDSMAPARIAGRHGDVTVPSLNITGWHDVFMQGAIDNYIAARAQGHTTRLVIGPWEHLSFGSLTPGKVGAASYGLASVAPPSGNGTLTGVQLAWFDQFLTDQPASGEPESGVDLFVMGINQWRREPQWPLERIRETGVFLHPGGRLSTSDPAEDESSSAYVYDPADPVPTTGGSLVMASAFPPGPQDQQAVESRDDVLVFTSDPLGEDLEITGRVTARLFASTDGPSTDWVVRLCDVDEKGTSLNIVDGIKRVHTESGRVDEHEIDLWSTSIVIKAGHRLRVQVTSSNFPRWDRNLNTGEDPLVATEHRAAHQRIFHDAARPSRLILPVIPAP
ncbi:CocE/NonD family hydrolase [Nocardia sp. NPDC127606]|uniref:CocE/NonD family hydrolase n=1 Tax=Nocardia sp. NPDC127606 TaxID=3345406 RepID=UPI003625569F